MFRKTMDCMKRRRSERSVESCWGFGECNGKHFMGIFFDDGDLEYPNVAEPRVGWRLVMTASEEAEESKRSDAAKHGTRLLVLGASNVRRSLYPILEIARRSFPGPLDFLIVAGHGRSYGAPNRVFGWSLPGISNSEWTQHWHRADTRPASRSSPMSATIYSSVTIHRCYVIGCRVVLMRSRSPIELWSRDYRSSVLEVLERSNFRSFEKFFFLARESPSKRFSRVRSMSMSIFESSSNSAHAHGLNHLPSGMDSIPFMSVEPIFGPTGKPS